MSGILNVEVKSGWVRTSTSSEFLQCLRPAVSAALLLAVAMLGAGSSDALAQTRPQPQIMEAPTFTASAEPRILPGMGDGAQHEVSPEAKTKQTLNYPYGLAVDPAGNLYVANLFGGVNTYSAKGFKLTNTITAGTLYPAAVSIAFGGNIYVANNAGNNITIYNPALQQVGTISDSSLYSPYSMYVDAANDVWVLDATGVLHLYLDNGAAAGTVATGGSAVGPWGPNVTVWGVANGAGSWSELFQNVGETLHYGPSLQNYFAGGSPEAGGEAQDSLFQQYVSDINHNQVQIWSSNGLYEVGAISTPAVPYGIAVDSVNKRIFVALTTVNEVAVYSTTSPYKLLATIH